MGRRPLTQAQRSQPQQGKALAWDIPSQVAFMNSQDITGTSPSKWSCWQWVNTQYSGWQGTTPPTMMWPLPGKKGVLSVLILARLKNALSPYIQTLSGHTISKGQKGKNYRLLSHYSTDINPLSLINLHIEISTTSMKTLLDAGVWALKHLRIWTLFLQYSWHLQYSITT